MGYLEGDDARRMGVLFIIIAGLGVIAPSIRPGLLLEVTLIPVIYEPIATAVGIHLSIGYSFRFKLGNMRNIPAFLTRLPLRPSPIPPFLIAA